MRLLVEETRMVELALVQEDLETPEESVNLVDEWLVVMEQLMERLVEMEGVKGLVMELKMGVEQKVVERPD